ncbi:MAG: thermonuclease family protein [Candidatus Omnitrophica bacterium]|nr:thermonuclease family protein [Candidatus Omnitrophota bacterium]MDD5500211.1 thermonuclease family protein [Candidatus Omnitrophota bacterium]
MRKNGFYPRGAVILLFVVLLALAGYLLGESQKGQPVPAASRFSGADSGYSNVLVLRVVDGDTLKLEDGNYVRLLGIDTPELHESAKLYRDSSRSGKSVEEIKREGKRSYEFTRALAEGRRVRLEFDTERRDKYNRILAYVFLQDGTFLNGRIVEEGYASITHYKMNTKYADEFLRLYRQARENRRGLWMDN